MHRILSDDEKKFLNFLRDRGICFSVELMGGNHWLDEEMLARYIKDPDEVEAFFQEVTIEDLRSFRNAEGATYCSATTKRGTPCKNFVPRGMSEYFYGRSTSMVRSWLDKQGKYCAFHEDARDVSRT